MRVLLEADDHNRPSGPWSVKYTTFHSTSSQERLHNHPPDDIMNLPLHRRNFRKKHTQSIQDSAASGIETSKIMANIRMQSNQACREAVII